MDEVSQVAMVRPAVLLQKQKWREGWVVEAITPFFF
jgi:hypothetical protein